MQPIQNGPETKIIPQQEPDKVAPSQGSLTLPDGVFKIVCHYVLGVEDEYDLRNLIQVVLSIGRSSSSLDGCFQNHLFEGLVAIKGLRQFFSNQPVPEYILRIFNCSYSITHYYVSWREKQTVQLSLRSIIQNQLGFDPNEKLLSIEDFPLSLPNPKAAAAEDTPDKKIKPNPQATQEVIKGDYKQTFYFEESESPGRGTKDNGSIVEMVNDAYYPGIDRVKAEKLLHKKPSNSWLVYPSSEEYDPRLFLCRVENKKIVHYVIQKDIPFEEFQQFIETHAELRVKVERQPLVTQAQIYDIAEKGFHLQCTREEAEKLLKNRPYNSWLVHPSSNKGLFEFSQMVQTKEGAAIHHLRIQMDISFEEFQQLVQDHAKLAVTDAEVKVS